MTKGGTRSHKRARVGAPVPLCLKDRVERGDALPTVEVVVGHGGGTRDDDGVVVGVVEMIIGPSSMMEKKKVWEEFVELMI